MTYVYLKSMQHYLRGLLLDAGTDKEMCAIIKDSITAIEEALHALH